MPSAEDCRIVSCRTDLHAFHSTAAVAIGWINSCRRETEMDNERARNLTQILICDCSRLPGRRVAATRIGAWGRDYVREVPKSRPEGRPQGPVAPAMRGRRRRHRFGPGRTASVQASNWTRFCAVVARAAHYAQVQETALSIRQEGPLGAERDPPPVFGARPPRAWTARGGQIRIGPHRNHQAWPDATVAATIDRILILRSIPRVPINFSRDWNAKQVSRGEGPQAIRPLGTLANATP